MDINKLIKQYENPNTDLYVLAEWLRNRKLEVDFRNHYLMEEWERLQKENPDIAEKLHRISARYSSPHQLHVTGVYGKISVIRGGASMGDYEIYCLEGNLFADIRRYRDVEHAGKTIHSLLTTGMFDETVPKVPSIWESPENDGPDGPLQEFLEE